MLEKLIHFTPAPKQMDDKVVLVTGASEGIGKAVALALAKHGATVLLLARNEEKLDAVYDEIESAGAPTPVIVPFDLANTDPAPYRELTTMIKEHFGRLDGLLHNAGALGKLTPLSQYSIDDFKQLLDVNLTSNFLLTQALLPLLSLSPSASVLFTSSGVGRKPRAYWGAYAISKAAIEALMQLFHQELNTSSTIRFNSLNPRATNTAMRRAAYPAENPASNPQPDELVNAYLYLLSDASAGISGQQLDARDA